MDKRTFNKVIKSLNRVINLDNKPIIASAFFQSCPALSHNYSYIAIEKIADSNPDFTEFDLLKFILEPIILKNPTNYAGLFECYDILAKKAKELNIEGYLDYYKSSYKAQLLRRLENMKDSGETELYAQIIGNNNVCESCQSLNNKAFKAENLLNNMPLPIKECKREYPCLCAFTVMSKRFCEKNNIEICELPLRQN